MSIEPEPTEDSAMNEVKAVAETDQSLRETVNQLVERVAQVEAQNESLRREKGELRQQNEQYKERIEALEDEIDEIHIARTQQISNAKAEMREEIDDVRDNLEEEKKTRSKHDSRIERRVATLADETDVDLSDTNVAGEDKIQRLIANGPEDIVDRVYDVHHRARDLLLHAGDWGEATKDDFGKRIAFHGPTVREKLNLHRNEDIQSNQMRRVFDKIEELARDSPRKVQSKTGKSDEVNKLVIYLDQEEVRQ